MSTILVIDDSTSFRAVVKLALQRAGHTVLEAGDGVQALKVLEDSHALPAKIKVGVRVFKSFAVKFNVAHRRGCADIDRSPAARIFRPPEGYVHICVGCDGAADRLESRIVLHVKHREQIANIKIGG